MIAIKTYWRLEHPDGVLDIVETIASETILAKSHKSFEARGIVVTRLTAEEHERLSEELFDRFLNDN